MNEYQVKTKCLNVRWEGHADCEHCAIRKNDIFSELEVERYDNILKPITQYYFPPKSLLYLQNEPAKELYVIRKGIVKLEETLDDGNARIVRLLQPSDVVGVEAFIDEALVYDQTAVVVRGAHVCKIPHSLFEKLMDENHQFYKSILEQWHRQLEAADQVILDFSTGSVHDRVAHVLLYLAKTARQRDSVEIEMLSVEDISALTGVARESISRVMAKFKRDGLLEKSGPNRMRYNWEGLAAQLSHIVG